MQTLRQVQNVAGHHSMRAVCILTHCDVVDKTIRKDARNVAQSSTVDRIRTYVALQLGLAPNLVRHPLRQRFLCIPCLPCASPSPPRHHAPLAVDGVPAAPHGASDAAGSVACGSLLAVPIPWVERALDRDTTPGAAAHSYGSSRRTRGK